MCKDGCTDVLPGNGYDDNDDDDKKPLNGGNM